MRAAKDTPPWFSLPPAPKPEQIAIVGAGLAGSWLARELAERGVSVQLIDSQEIHAQAASRNAVGIFKPYVTRDQAPSDTFYRLAFDWLLHRLDALDVWTAAHTQQSGVLQLTAQPWPKRDGLTPLTPEQASTRANTRIDSPALWFPEGGHINPRALCRALTQHPRISRIDDRVTAIGTVRRGKPGVLRLRHHTLDTQWVVLASGHRLPSLLPEPLPLTPARGQLNGFKVGCAQLACVVTGKRYAIPQTDRLTAGASFVRDDTGCDIRAEEREETHRHVRRMLPELQWSGSDQDDDPNARGWRNAHGADDRAAVRATTPDRLPLLGPLPELGVAAGNYADLHHGRPVQHYAAASYQDGLGVFGGLGSRGIVTAPYCAALLADWLCESAQAPHTLSCWSELLHPARFLVRDLKRHRHRLYCDSPQT